MSQIQVELQETMGSDRSIAESAWTSSLDYQKKQTRTDADVARVVKMLADNKHSTPFESVIFKFWIKMPIAIDRQHMTHRIGSHNGMSGRYRTMPNEYLEIPKDTAAILCQFYDGYDYFKEIRMDYERLCSDANEWYQSFVETCKDAKENEIIDNNQYKRLREFFRGVLPQHNMTERVTIFNLRSFANYQKLRNSEHAQPEIQQVAKLMLDAVKAKNICPIALAQLEQNGWNI
jgi:flavin-dependent thymidylate synthase